MKKTLSIIIVSWNVRADVVQCIDSIAANPPSQPYEIILVDNASSDDTVVCVRERFPDIVLVENLQNLGFAAANNIGIQTAVAPYLLFLNPDTIVLPQSLDKLIAFMDQHPDAALCGPRILNADRTIQPSVRRFPNVAGMFYRFTFFKYLGIFRSEAAKWKMDDFDHLQEADVEQIMGAAIVARSELIKAMKGFDERFFMYYEEVDLCRRVRQDGWRVIFYPAAEIIHLGGQSSRHVPVKTKFMMLRSLMLYMKKHHPNPVLLAVFKVNLILTQILELLICSAILPFFLWASDKRSRQIGKIKTAWGLLFKYGSRLLGV